MTRLATSDFAPVADRLDAYDDTLVRRTGLDLMGLACRAAGIKDVDDFKKKHAGKR